MPFIWPSGGGRAAIANDLGGTPNQPQVIGFQDIPLATTALLGGDVFYYDSGTATWKRDVVGLSDRTIYPMFHAIASESLAIWTRVATVIWLGSAFKLGSVNKPILSGVLETTGGTGYIRLYNTTTPGVVAGSELSTTSATPVPVLSPVLTLPDAVYELQLRVSVNTATATLSMGRIDVGHE